MALTAESKAEIVKEFGSSENDSGYPEVQVALLKDNFEQLQSRPLYPSDPSDDI